MGRVAGPSGIASSPAARVGACSVLHATIRELERERQKALKHDRGSAIEKVRQLLRLRAIGPNGTWAYENEFFGWRQFRNRKEVGAAAARKLLIDLWQFLEQG